MLEKVKQKLEASKEPLVPISLRIESSSKTAISVLADSYGVKSNELIRYIFQVFIEEAWNEPVNNGESKLGELLELIHPEIRGGKIISRGFIASIIDPNLGDTEK